MSQKKEKILNNGYHWHSQTVEMRLNRIHRLFKNQYNVTEPSLILEPFLFLGNCISAQDINRLTKLGIRYVLNVAIRDVEICPYYGDKIRAHAIDLRDDDRENIIRTFEQAFGFIDEAKENRSRILVHCSHGQSRSPAIVIAYLMRTYDVSLEQCLIHVIKARPCVSPNDGFLKQLILFDRFLVDRRCKREQTIVDTVVNNNGRDQKLEIPIHHRKSNELTGRVAEKSTTSTATVTKVDSEMINLKSKRTSSPTIASVRSMNSKDDSIHVVPIQTSTVDSMKPISIQSNSNKFALSTACKSVERNKPKRDTTIQNSETKSRSILNAHGSGSQDDLNVKLDGQSDTIVSRSKSAHPERSRKQTSYRYQQQQKVQLDERSSKFPQSVHQTVTDYGIGYKTKSNPPEKTRYVTEIYDQATNRFILTGS